MSKRFGRNQRRRMQAQIDTLKAEVLSQRRDLCAQERTVLEQNRAINLTREILGQYFAGLPPQVVETDEIRETFCLPKPIRSSLQEEAAQLTADLVTLDTLRSHVELDELQQMMHVRFFTRHGHVAYGHSYRAFHAMPVHETVRTLSEEMARMLANSLR